MKFSNKNFRFFLHFTYFSCAHSQSLIFRAVIFSISSKGNKYTLLAVICRTSALAFLSLRQSPLNIYIRRSLKKTPHRRRPYLKEKPHKKPPPLQKNTFPFRKGSREEKASLFISPIAWEGKSWSSRIGDNLSHKENKKGFNLGCALSRFSVLSLKKGSKCN